MAILCLAASRIDSQMVKEMRVSIPITNSQYTQHSPRLLPRRFSGFICIHRNAVPSISLAVMGSGVTGSGGWGEASKEPSRSESSDPLSLSSPSSSSSVWELSREARPPSVHCGRCLPSSGLPGSPVTGVRAVRGRGPSIPITWLGLASVRTRVANRGGTLLVGARRSGEALLRFPASPLCSCGGVAAVVPAPWPAAGSMAGLSHGLYLAARVRKQENVAGTKKATFVFHGRTKDLNEPFPWPAIRTPRLT